MTGWVWLGIIIGLAIVALAVGIPYALTHKTMRSPHDLSEGKAYLHDKRRWRQRGAAASSPNRRPGGVNSTGDTQDAADLPG
jgi:hypothetical protein